MVALLVPATDVLGKLGVKGRFVTPGGGTSAIVGDPDFSWITTSGSPRHPKVIVEYKAWWAADLVNPIAAFHSTENDTLSEQSVHALQQTYGYMAFNNNKFGILTNWKHALFLRRAETPDRKTLEYYLVELNRAGQPISMLKVFVGMVLLAEDDWFYPCPTLFPAPLNLSFGTSPAAWKNRRAAVAVAGGYSMQPVNGAYQRRPIDFHLCCLDPRSARPRVDGCVVTATLLSQSAGFPDLNVVCKIADALHSADAASSLNDEACTYAALQDLQGKVIPTLHGFYEVWGILQFLALEPVGNADRKSVV